MYCKLATRSVEDKDYDFSRINKVYYRQHNMGLGKNLWGGLANSFIIKFAKVARVL